MSYTHRLPPSLPSPLPQIVARMCCLLGKAYMELDNLEIAVMWLRRALYCDVFCAEVRQRRGTGAHRAPLSASSLPLLSGPTRLSSS